jgi:hypothetical protein
VKKSADQFAPHQPERKFACVLRFECRIGRTLCESWRRSRSQKKSPVCLTKRSIVS